MADMGVTETTATSRIQIAETIQMYLVQEALLADKVTTYFANKGDASIKIPRAGGFTVDDKAENTAVTAQVITYAADTLALDKHKVIQVLLEDIANIQASPDIIQDILMRMAKDLAYKVDDLIEDQLQLASASSPDHRLAYANTSTLGKADLLIARKLLAIQNIKFSECFIGVSPASESDLLAIDDFVHVDKYGASAAGLSNGEIGRLYGARVVMSNAFADAKTLVWHPTAIGFAMQRQPNFNSQYILEKLGTLYSLDSIYGVKVLDSGKRQVMLGTAA